MDIYIELMSIEWINSKVLLYNMGNHIQYPAITHNRKKYKKECVCIYIYVCVCVCVCVKGKLLSRVWLFETPWNSPGQNTGVDSLSLLQGMFPTQGSKPGLPHCRQILYQLSHKVYVFINLNHFAVQQKLPQCKSTVLQFKKKRKSKTRGKLTP